MKDFVKSSWKADLYGPIVAHLRSSRSMQEALAEKLLWLQTLGGMEHA